MKSLTSIIYPSQCIGCGELVADEAALCPDCWRGTPFIHGSACFKCGAPLMGEAPGDEAAECDDCIQTPREWKTGVSVLRYDGVARRLVISFKHGDRHDLANPFATWMAARINTRIQHDDIFVPVPIHWRRMIKRKFNQSALLAKQLGRFTGAIVIPDALIRTANTKRQDGLSFEERFALQAGKIRPNPKRQTALQRKRVFLVDDVMTSGATLASCSAALLGAGVREVHTVTLARVVKEI